VLSSQDRTSAVDLIRKMGGCAEMNRLILAMGEQPCAFTLPSVAYVQWRLQITDVSDQVRRAVALLELGRDGRQLLYSSKSGRPQTLRDVVLSIVGLPRTAVDIFGSQRRWRRSLHQPTS
jgi:hypothetical protein